MYTFEVGDEVVLNEKGYYASTIGLMNDDDEDYAKFEGKISGTIVEVFYDDYDMENMYVVRIKATSEVDPKLFITLYVEEGWGYNTFFGDELMLVHAKSDEY